MVCVFCGNVETSVTNSRSSNRRGQVWRRRSCEKCRRVFTTRESAEVGFLEVLKRSGVREKFSRAKLLRSLILATDHLKEPETAFALADTVETRLLSALQGADGVLSSEMIADTTQLILKRYDARSYVKYLSYQTEELDARDLRKKLASKS